MRRTSAFVFRILLTFIFIGAQTTLLLLWYMGIVMYFDIVFYGVLAAGLCVVIYIANRRDNSAYKLGWTVLILIFPLMGALMYFSAGNKSSSRRFKKQLLASRKDIIPYYIQDDSIIEKLSEEDTHLGSMSRFIKNAGDYPVYSNTSTKYYNTGETYFEDIIEKLKKAEKYIFFEFFIIGIGELWDRILEILKQKVEEGVDVRVIYDDFGSILTLPFRYNKKLEKMGIKCLLFNKFTATLSFSFNNRDHRKIIVIDGHTAYTGGINIADEYANIKDRFGHWKDAGIRLEGHAVMTLSLMFIEAWNAFSKKDKIVDINKYRPAPNKNEDFNCKGFVQPYGSNPIKPESLGQGVYLHLINYAVNYIYIFSPYLILDDECMTALCNAAKRGVDVKIIMPGRPDKRVMYFIGKSYFPILVESGIKIYFYQPGFIHSKCLVSDDSVATIGTINMDFRSMYLHFENNITLYKSQSVIDIRDDFTETLNDCKLVEEKDYKTGIFSTMLKAILRLIAPLF